MKNLIILSFVIALGFNNAYAQQSICEEAIGEHVDLIHSTDTYFSQVYEHANSVSSYEVTQIQEKLTERFLSLKKLFKLYEDENYKCPDKTLLTAVAIYDFTQVAKSIFSSKILRRVVKGFIKFEDYQLRDYLRTYKYYTKKKLIDTFLKNSKASETINEEIRKSISEVNKAPSSFAISDVGVKATTSVVAGAARLLAFISDHLAWRQGRLKDNSDAQNLLAINLKPLDLIYEKRAFLLTNYTIPGHWGHIGIWLGSKEELIEMGVWNKEYFAPMRKFVEEGRNIIEIRKDGVHYKSLKNFMNLDEVAITRVKNIGDTAQNVYSEISKQINKKYDFKFDARSADKVTCSEFIAFSYGDLQWQETKTLFQISLSPDDIAISTLGHNPHSEFVLYLKGNKDKSTFINLGLEDWSKLYKKKK